MNLISSFRIQKHAIKFHHLSHSFFFTTTTTSDYEYRAPKHPLSSTQCTTILLSLTNSKSLQTGQILHGYTLSSGLFQGNTNLSTKFAAFYATCGCMNYAHIIFDQIVNKSAFLWNFMIRGYATNGFSMQAISLYRTMMTIGVLSDNFTYPFVIKACGDLVDVYLGRIVHAQAVVNGFHFNVYVANFLIAMYVDFRDMENARKMFDVMPKRDLTSWNTMISGYTKNDNPEALRIFQEMLVTGAGLDSTIDCHVKRTTGNKMDDECESFLAEVGGTVPDSMRLESGSWQVSGRGGHPGLGLNMVRNNKDYDETKFTGQPAPPQPQANPPAPYPPPDHGLNYYPSKQFASGGPLGSVPPPSYSSPAPWGPSPPYPGYPTSPPGSSYDPPSMQTHIMQSQGGVYEDSPVSMAPRTNPSYIPSSNSYSPYYGTPPPPAKQPQVPANVPRALNPPTPRPVGRLLRELMRSKGSSWQI